MRLLAARCTRRLFGRALRQVQDRRLQPTKTKIVGAAQPRSRQALGLVKGFSSSIIARATQQLILPMAAHQHQFTVRP